MILPHHWYLLSPTLRYFIPSLFISSQLPSISSLPLHSFTIFYCSYLHLFHRFFFISTHNLSTIQDDLSLLLFNGYLCKHFPLNSSLLEIIRIFFIYICSFFVNLYFHGNLGKLNLLSTILVDIANKGSFFS